METMKYIFEKQAKVPHTGQASKALATCLIGAVSISAMANEQQSADGTLGRFLFGDDFGRDTMTRIGGWVQVGAVLKDSQGQQAGLGNSPVVLARDRGIQLNQLYLYLEKSIRTNIVPRATPIPGPAPENYSVGFHIDAMYGRDGQPMQTFGWDDRWSANHPGNAEPEKAARDRQNFLIVPQAYIQAYLPWGLGTSVIAGNFMSPVGNEIGFHPQPGPNIFYSHTYSFAVSPIKHTGVLAATNLLNSDSLGLVAAELGVVAGWSNFQDNNSQPAYLGALRYRSAAMDTWIDYEFITGDAQSSMNKLLSDPRDANVPITRVISPRGQRKTQHFLTVSHDWDNKWHAQIGFNYGKQEGDGGEDTVDIISGRGFKGASWKGVEARIKYALTDQFSVAARVEKFQDRDGFSLFPNTLGVKGDFNAATVGAQYWVNKHLLFRPEIRHDWQTKNQGVRAFNAGRDERQTTLNADIVFYF